MLQERVWDVQTKADGVFVYVRMPDVDIRSLPLRLPLYSESQSHIQQEAQSSATADARAPWIILSASKALGSYAFAAVPGL